MKSKQSYHSWCKEKKKVFMKDWGEGDGLTSIDKMVGPGQVKVYHMKTGGSLLKPGTHSVLVLLQGTSILVDSQ